MILVGLTGGIGSGKSTVARMLADHGAVVADADLLARASLEPESPGHQRVVERFGTGVLRSDGRVDRERMAEIVFTDPEARRDLEAITHPEVFRALAELVHDSRDTDGVIVFDAALLVETGFDETCDVVVVVTAPEDLRLKRLVARGMDEEEARRRIAAQIPDEKRRSKADVVIDNAGDLPSLEARVAELWQDLGARAAGPA